jgi:hypothetical protein
MGRHRKGDGYDDPFVKINVKIEAGLYERFAGRCDKSNKKRIAEVERILNNALEMEVTHGDKKEAKR